MDSARHAVFEVGGRRSPLTAALAAAVLFLPAALFVLPATALAAPTFEQALSRGIGWAFLATLVGGLLTSLTPCVLPLVPITLGLMGARGKGVSRMRAFSLASVYVLGIALPYTVLGLVAGLGGAAFG